MINQIFYTLLPSQWVPTSTYSATLLTKRPSHTTYSVNLAMEAIGWPLLRILQQTQTQTLSFPEDQMQTYVQATVVWFYWTHGWNNASRWENSCLTSTKTGSTIVALDGPAHGLSSGTNSIFRIMPNFTPGGAAFSTTNFDRTLRCKTCVLPVRLPKRRLKKNGYPWNQAISK
jgi:hypothetical protein